MNEPKVLLSYIPHGINPKKFYKIDPNNAKDMEFKAGVRKQLFGDDDAKVKFVIFYNSRNIRRKRTSDVIMAYKDFWHKLPASERESCRLVMHTQPIDEHGTDLPAVIRDLCPEIKVVFSSNRTDTAALNAMYNIADGLISMSSNEGFGLSLAEALMTETPIIATVTGGMQDQMGFRDDDGNLMNPDVHFCKEWGTNADGKYRVTGDWALPLYPKVRTLIGSPPTPYIFDCYCTTEDATVAIMQLYQMTPEERARRGTLGREFCMGAGQLNADNMCGLFMKHIDVALTSWKPRKRFGLYTV